MSDSLRGFILRGEALKLYRNFLRTAQQAPPSARGVSSSQMPIISILQMCMSRRHAASSLEACTNPRSALPPQLFMRSEHDLLAFAGEVRQQIRLGFEAHRSQTEEYARKYLLSDGRAQLKQLRDTLMLRE